MRLTPVSGDASDSKGLGAFFFVVWRVWRLRVRRFTFSASTSFGALSLVVRCACVPDDAASHGDRAGRQSTGTIAYRSFHNPWKELIVSANPIWFQIILETLRDREEARQALSRAEAHPECPEHIVSVLRDCLDDLDLLVQGAAKAHPDMYRAALLAPPIPMTELGSHREPNY